MIQDAQNRLATTLAACASFRTFVGAVDATAALLRIHHDSVTDKAADAYTPEELVSIRPCAMIYTLTEGGFRYTRDAAGTNNWKGSGRLVCLLERDTPGGMTTSALDVDMREKAGAIMSDLVDLSETGGYLAITDLGANGPFRTPEDDRSEIGDRQAFEILIEWGNR